MFKRPSWAVCIFTKDEGNQAYLNNFSHIKSCLEPLTKEVTIYKRKEHIFFIHMNEKDT